MFCDSFKKTRRLHGFRKVVMRRNVGDAMDGAAKVVEERPHGTDDRVALRYRIRRSKETTTAVIIRITMAPNPSVINNGACFCSWSIDHAG